MLGEDVLGRVQDQAYPELEFALLAAQLRFSQTHR
jgi:hypothetical protein